MKSRILFMGTPEIAAISLEKLIFGGANIVGVLTREDKPRGRGNVMTPTPVKVLAEKNGINVYTPATLKDGACTEVLERENPELIVVVAYGKILPSYVLSYPKHGCINLHVSLLPKYRGAAPMQRAIMMGERETGVTVMYMNEGLDTGDIISVEKFPIGPEDNFEDIHDRSADIGSHLLSATVKSIENATATRTPQDDSLATYAAKIEKSECRIDLSADARELDCKIRGLTPIPGAFVYNGGKMLDRFFLFSNILFIILKIKGTHSLTPCKPIKIFHFSGKLSHGSAGKFISFCKIAAYPSFTLFFFEFFSTRVHTVICQAK